MKNDENLRGNIFSLLGLLLRRAQTQSSYFGVLASNDFVLMSNNQDQSVPEISTDVLGDERAQNVYIGREFNTAFGGSQDSGL